MFPSCSRSAEYKSECIRRRCVSRLVARHGSAHQPALQRPYGLQHHSRYVRTSLPSEICLSFKPLVSEGGVAAVDVCLFGVRTIMPLMTAELLRFPTLCQQYYKMVCFAAEIYPERVATLPEDQLSYLVGSVHMGFTAFGPDISSLCCDFVFVLCQHLHSNMEQLASSPCREMLHPILKVLHYCQ